MSVAVFVEAWRDDGGEWRFAIKTDSGGRGQLISGTEESQDGMSEPQLRKFMTEEFQATSTEVEQAVQGAKDQFANR